jgi:alpha-methylacyl-CoA racemase
VSVYQSQLKEILLNSKLTSGPLGGVKIVIVGGIAPGPFAGMLLADLGADVIKIDRPEESGKKANVLARSQRSVVLNLKTESGIAAALALFDHADAIIEGYRPGVMERLGLGPEVALIRNQKLIYGRITGWGQSGPLSQTAGHDINYIALSGALHAMGTTAQPVAPLNVLGDFAGGALYMAMGLLAGILRARTDGTGQVIDCSMAEGSASLMTLFYELHANGRWGERGSNFLDGGAPFYNTFRCSDGHWLSIGAIEPQFYAILRKHVGLNDSAYNDQMNTEHWPVLKEKMADIFGQRTRDEWCTLLEGTDACVAPVLDMTEAPNHPHHLDRGSFVEIEGIWQPGIVPRFSATPSSTPLAPSHIGEDTKEALTDWGVSDQIIESLI